MDLLAVLAHRAAGKVDLEAVDADEGLLRLGLDPAQAGLRRATSSREANGFVT